MTSSDHTEVEWQFDAGEGLDRVTDWLARAAVPGYTVSRGKKKQLEDRYYDTPGWRINHAGFTCRVRDKDDGPEITLKGMATSVGGMRSRREMNEPLVAGSVPFDGGAGPCSRAVRTVAGRETMAELFHVSTTRQIFLLADDAGSLAEIAVDLTKFEANGTPAESGLQRVEVEVEDGAVERARRFVDLFVVATGLVPADKSKFETGLLAAGLTVSPRSPALGATAVTDDLTAGQTAFAIMRKHFGVFLANEAGTRLGEDIEALHDMRVAARRLRAAMSAFSAYLPPVSERHRAQLGWVAAALGEVRDLDVQIERMAEWRDGFEESGIHALDAVENLLQERRVVARRRMLFALDSRRYEGFVARFSAFLRQGPPRTFGPGKEPILAVAPDLLSRRYRGLRKRGDAIAPASPPAAYHELRIFAKKLRYALEFVGPIYGKPAIEFSQRVTALQDILGLHQDAEVAITMLHEMAASQSRRLGPATIMVMGAISERYRRDAERLRGEFPAAYKNLGDKPWRAFIKDVRARTPGSEK